MVGPTKTNPRDFRSAESAFDSGVLATRSAMVRGAGAGRRPVRPDQPVEPAVLAQRDDRAGVGARGLDLGPVAHDPGVAHQALHVVVAEPRDRVGIEAGEHLAEGRALGEDGQPAQAGLERLERDPLEEGPLAVHRHAPLGVVVEEVQRMGGRPGAARQPVLADDGPAGRRVAHDAFHRRVLGAHADAAGPVSGGHGGRLVGEEDAVRTYPPLAIALPADGQSRRP